MENKIRFSQSHFRDTGAVWEQHFGISFCVVFYEHRRCNLIIFEKGSSEELSLTVYIGRRSDYLAVFLLIFFISVDHLVEDLHFDL